MAKISRDEEWNSLDEVEFEEISGTDWEGCEDEDEWEYTPPEDVHIKCWKVVDGKMEALPDLEMEMWEDLFNMALASFRTGNYKYMNEDKRFAEYVSGLAEYVRCLEELDEDVEIRFEYPEEVQNRKRLTKEEIAYYKGDGRIECPEDDYKYVDDVDLIVNRAQYDVLTRQKKRSRFGFANDAEYRLYLITLYDYAQLDEM